MKTAYPLRGLPSEGEVQIGNDSPATLVGEARRVPFRTHLPQEVRRHDLGRRVTTGRIDQDIELHPLVGIEVGEARLPIPFSRVKPDGMSMNAPGFEASSFALTGETSAA